MKLVANWRRVLKHAWSTRFTALAAVAGAAEVALPYTAGLDLVPAGVFAVISFGLTLAAGFARFVAQEHVSGAAE